jgi:hypothetical protein
MILQLDPMLEMSCPRGSGKAAFLIDYGLEGQMLWTIFLDNGEIWTYPNHEVRLKQNITAGRKYENYTKTYANTTVNDFSSGNKPAKES